MKMRIRPVRAMAIVMALLGAASCTANGPLVSSASPSPVAKATTSPSATVVPTAQPTPTALQVNPGSWLRWKLMSVPRADFTATVLPGGKVLLAGGETTTTTDTNTVDIFDPVTNSITSAAPMKQARNGHTATLLTNGKVIVLGGSAMPGGPGLASAEVYEPKDNTWSSLPPMSVGRVHHAAVLLSSSTSGKVLVAGGTPVPSPVEIYNWSVNAWTSVTMPSSAMPFGPTATELADGRVMIVGGANGGSGMANGGIWIYDPATGQMNIARAMPPQGGTNWATATRLADGRVLVAGGEDSTTPAGAVSRTFIYDPAERAPAGAPMNVGHCHHTMTVLQNGLVLVAGGRCGSQDSINVSELYDPASQTWHPASPLQDPRGYHVAALLPDGRVMAAGGIYPVGTIAQTTEIYTPS